MHLYLLLVALPVATLAINPCKYGSYDFTSLISPTGNYRWTQLTVPTSGDIFISFDPTTAVNVTYELQVCDPITNSISKNCNQTNSMVNQIDQFGNCLSLGRADVGMFNVNPYADGAFAAVYNGDWIDHVQAYSSHVYFVCDTTQNMSAPLFEHMKATYQAHFTISTKFAC